MQQRGSRKESRLGQNVHATEREQRREPPRPEFACNREGAEESHPGQNVHATKKEPRRERLMPECSSNKEGAEKRAAYARMFMQQRRSRGESRIDRNVHATKKEPRRELHRPECSYNKEGAEERETLRPECSCNRERAEEKAASVRIFMEQRRSRGESRLGQNVYATKREQRRELSRQLREQNCAYDSRAVETGALWSYEVYYPGILFL
ncbi:hypothetical protein NDU88_007147 [Pleurodeles waltl]|uniref:Uncharacterized protein n=1 Tax=Pleurodeles waltl TaxID=8319 RepID=A0AAV7LR83_PLEWA|nr:hypothetical protein NDU88_007147 [Pleurodeles waltl]